MIHTLDYIPFNESAEITTCTYWNQDLIVCLMITIAFCEVFQVLRVLASWVVK